MNEMDKRKFGYFVFGGALIGAFLGFLASGFLSIWVGTLAGVAIGWFAAAYFLEKEKGRKEEKKE